MPGPRSDESSPLGELLTSMLVLSSSQDEPPELEMILSITASDAEEFLSDGEQESQAVGPKARSPERPEAGTSVKEGARPRVRSVVSRVSRRASPTGPARRDPSPSPSPPPALRRSGRPMPRPRDPSPQERRTVTMGGPCASQEDEYMSPEMRAATNHALRVGIPGRPHYALCHLCKKRVSNKKLKRHVLEQHAPTIMAFRCNLCRLYRSSKSRQGQAHFQEAPGEYPE